jgi:glycosyltransferase involved in cell wall biosynthesis
MRRQRPDWQVKNHFGFRRTGGLESLPLLSDALAAARVSVPLLRGHVDVVVAHGTSISMWLLMVQRITRRRWPLVVVWHGAGATPIVWSGASGSPLHRLLVPLHRTIESIASRADAHIAVHDKVANPIRALSPSRPVAVIPNGVAIPVGRRSRQRRPDGFSVLWVGQVARLKGLDTALQACAIARSAIPSLRLHVVGLQPQDHHEDWVVWHGVVAPNDVWGLYQASDVFLFPSRYEAFGLAVLEAMAAGLPVVVSEAAASVAVDGESGFVVRGHDPSSYARALVALYSQPAVADAIADANVVRASHFNWESISEGYARIAETAAEGGRRPVGVRA